MAQCLICTTQTASMRKGAQGIEYYHCSMCDLIFKDPAAYQSLDEQKSRYDLHENDEESAGYRAYFQRFLDFVLPHLDEGVKEALDFGCGRSRLLALMLHQAGIVCDAYDPIYHPNGYNKKKRYDLIVSTEVFEHLHQPKESFEMLVASLKEGGYLAIQTQFHPQNKTDFFSWYYPKDPTHIVFFSPQTFQHLAQMFHCRYVADNGKNMVLFKKA